MKTLVGAAIGTFGLGVLLLASGVVGPFDSGSRLTDAAGRNALDALGRDGAVVVACEAGQRAVVQHVRVNGGEVSYVDCVSAADTAFASDRFARYDTSYGAGDVRIVPAAYPTVERRVEPVRRVVYRDPPSQSVSRPRSWQKSLLIIGGTAGAGAGVGAIVGGKKGALLGAAIGGGAATVYDQITRRRPAR